MKNNSITPFQAFDDQKNNLLELHSQLMLDKQNEMPEKDTPPELEEIVDIELTDTLDEPALDEKNSRLWDPVQAYICVLQKHPILTPAQERKTLEKMVHSREACFFVLTSQPCAARIIADIILYQRNKWRAPNSYEQEKLFVFAKKILRMVNLAEKAGNPTKKRIGSEPACSDYQKKLIRAFAQKQLPPAITSLALQELFQKKDSEKKIPERAQFHYQRYQESREKLFYSIARMVLGKAMKTAKKFGYAEEVCLELIQAANEGALTAIERFKLEKNCRLSTYVMCWITQRIGNACRHLTYQKTGQSATKFGDYKEALHKLTQEKKRKPHAQEIADEMQISLQRLEAVIRGNSKPLSYDVQFGNSDDTLVTTLESPLKTTLSAHQPELVWKTVRSILYEHFCNGSNTPWNNKRAEKHYKVLYQIYAGSLTLEDAGKLQGFSKQCAAQIKERALKILRDSPKYLSQLKQFL